MNPTLVLFWAFFGLAVMGAIATMTRRNTVVAVICLVGTFFAVAAEFLLLAAPFLAVLQVLVYAGAIMVLFVFVVMVVSRGEASPRTRLHSPVARVLGLAAAAVLIYRAWLVFRTVDGRTMAEPPGSFGTVETVGRTLLTDYMFPFELVSLLLLVAVVGALVIARQHHDKTEEKAS